MDGLPTLSLHHQLKSVSPGALSRRLARIHLPGWMVLALLYLALTLLPLASADWLLPPASTAAPAATAPTGQDPGPWSQPDEPVQARTSGAAIRQVFRIAGALAGPLAEWLAWAAAISVGSLFLGGRITFRASLPVVVRAWLPLALRSLVQAGYILLLHQAPGAPGLAGFISTDPLNPGTLLLAHFAGGIEIYRLVFLLLLVRGCASHGRVSRRKATGLVLVFGLLLALLTALPAQAQLAAEASLHGIYLR